ncbi:hypothetical protein Acr_00g0069490 [Actinidia rufa]|uniref:Integrase catalytic domain-containing protein n=1 Tax=Actinidia rufa TaxID=165716 RepID=A0A7J0DQY4_9ERIC|nr:hypothetical protein Acr_00g0069490 [Actinidia rufa]
MSPRKKPRRGRATNLARGPRGRGQNARLQDEGSQHDGNPVVEVQDLNKKSIIRGLAEIRKLFNVLVINDDDMRVHLVACQLSGKANEWWESILVARRDARRVVRVAKNVEVPNIEKLTWAKFEKMFENQYFPKSYREQLRDKFEKFEQGTMTISEYAMQYQALSRFAPKLVNTEENKYRRFEKGLQSSVRKLVMSSRLRVFIEIVELARTLKLSRDNVRNARGNKRRQSMGTGTFFYRVWGTLIKTAGHLPLVWSKGHIRAHCPQTPSQLRPPPPLRSQTPGACFGCGGFGHGPQGNRGASSFAPNPTTQGRVFAVTMATPPPPPITATQTLEASIVKGTFLLFNSFAGVLFDSRASHSFIATSFVLALGLEIEELNPPLFIDTLIGALGMSGFDLILEMDWLSMFHVTIDCFKCRVRIYMLEGSCLEVFGERQESFEPYLYEPRDKGSIAYLLASLTLDKDLSTRGELPRVVCDFSNIFLEELPGLPPKSEVEFTINLLPELNLRQRCWMEHLKDYNIDLQYHPGKANMVADALSRKPASLLSLAIDKWRTVRDLGFCVLHCEELSEGVTLCNLTVHSTLLTRVVEAQQDDEEMGVLRTKFLSGEASEGWRIHADQSICFQGKLFMPIACREEILREFHHSPLAVHPGGTKMYYDLRRQFWWPGLKKDVAIFVSKCLTCQQVKAEHQRPPESYNRYRDLRFTAHFWQGLQSALGTSLLLSTAYHPQTDGQSERTIQILEDMLQACVLDFRGSWEDHLPLVKFAYNNSYQLSIEMAPYEALYGKPCRSPVCWTELSEAVVVGPELVAETTESMGLIRKRLKAAQKATTKKVKVIRQRLLTAQSRQKSYADRRRRPLSFEVGDHVFLKVLPHRGLHRFGCRGKLSPRYIGPFDIIERIGKVAYRLALPPKLSGVHDVFHVFMLKKYEPDPSHVLEWSELELEADASFEEKPTWVVDSREKMLRGKTIRLVRIFWNNFGSEESIWEMEDEMREKYPNLFAT